MSLNKFKIPAWYRPTFFPQSLLYGTAPSRVKIAGYKHMYPDFSKMDFKRLANMELDTGGFHADIPDEDKFSLLKLGPIGCTHHSTVQEFENAGAFYALYTNHTAKMVVTDEFGEELINSYVADGVPWPETQNRTRQRVLAFHRGYTNAVRAQRGVGVGDVYNFGEYAGIGLIGSTGKPGSIRTASNKPAEIAKYRNSLSSREQARKRFNPGTSSFETYNDDYFNEKSDYFNVLHKLYYMHMDDADGGFFPLLQYAVEKSYVAVEERRQLGFTWEGIQDMAVIPFLGMDARDGWKYQFANGQLYVGNNMGTVIPPYVAMGIAFYTSLRTEGFVVWSGYAGIEDIGPDSNYKTIFGYWDDGWKTNGNIRKWTPTGGSEADWVQGGPGQPGDPQASPGGFSKYPMQNIDGFAIGRMMYDFIQPYITQGLEWAEYSRDGGAAWYVPASGTRGRAVSGYMAANYSASNPVIDIFIDNKPIVYVGKGNGKVGIVYQNPWILPTATEHVVVRFEGNNYDLGNLIGSDIHVFEVSPSAPIGIE